VAQKGVFPTGEYSRRLSGEWRWRRVPHEVDAPIKAVKPSLLHATRDRPSSHPDRQELGSGHDAVLARSKFGDRLIRPFSQMHNTTHVALMKTCAVSCIAYVRHTPHLS
jgi:hypothetical protein